MRAVAGRKDSRARRESFSGGQALASPDPASARLDTGRTRARSEIMMSTTARMLLVGLVIGCGQPAQPGLPPGAEHHHPATMVHRFDDAEAWAKVFDAPA